MKKLVGTLMFALLVLPFVTDCRMAAQGTDADAVMEIPFCGMFLSDEDFALWASVSPDGSKSGWALGSGKAKMSYQTRRKRSRQNSCGFSLEGIDMDEFFSSHSNPSLTSFLVSPAIPLESGKYYSMAYDFGSTGTAWYRIMIGKGKSLAEYKDLVPNTGIRNLKMTLNEEKCFSVEEDGEYHFVICCALSNILSSFSVSMLAVGYADDMDVPTEVSGLTATASGDDVVLNWQSPAVAPNRITEDFEAATVWDEDVPYHGFTYIDNDNGYAYELIRHANLPFYGHQCAYVVWNSDTFNFQDLLYAHSGKQFMAAVSKCDADGNDVACSSWLVSPRLYSADAQTVSFWARSVTIYEEKYKVMYSTSGNEVEDFQEIVPAANAPQEWTEVSVDLPEGATYFAVVYVCEDGAAFLVDDVTCTVASGKIPVSYEIYIDGEYAGYTFSSSTTWTDSSAAAENHVYSVVAVYENGRKSFPVTVNYSSAASVPVVSDRHQSGIMYDLNGRRVLTPVKGQVYIMDGKKYLAD